MRRAMLVEIQTDKDVTEEAARAWLSATLDEHMVLGDVAIMREDDTIATIQSMTVSNVPKLPEES